MEKRSHKEFLSRLCKKAARKNRILEVTWEITGYCNLNCQHCYLPAQTRRSLNSGLKFDQLKSIIDQLSLLGCFNITLTGGEIFTRKDILRILGYLKNKGFCLSLLTNGTLITAEIAELLSAFNPPVEVRVSLYSLKEEVNARITGRRGALAGTLRAIALLKDKGVTPSISFLIMQDNFYEFEAIQGFARSRQFGFYYSYFLRPRLDGAQDVMRFQITDAMAEEIMLKENDSFYPRRQCREEPQLRFSKENIFYCAAGSIAMAINPDGKANICLDLPLPGYDILKEGVSACWEKVVRFVKNIKPSRAYQCYKCELGDYCAWCPALGWRYKTDMDSCLPFYKRLARIHKDVSSVADSKSGTQKSQNAILA